MPLTPTAEIIDTAVRAGVSTAIKRGMTKINVATHLNKAFTEAVREQLARDPSLVDTRRYLGAGREAVAREVESLLGVLGAAGTAPPRSLHAWREMSMLARVAGCPAHDDDG